MDWFDMPEVDGYDKILLFVDKYSKMVKLHPCKKGQTTAADTINAIQMAVIRQFGIPEMIISDGDTRLNSTAWDEFVKKHNIEMKMSSTAHPQTDGQSENMVKRVREKFRLLGGQWLPHLVQVEYAINNSVSSVTGKTPFEVVLGFNPTLCNSENSEPVEFVKRNCVHFEDEEIDEKITETDNQQKQQYDKHRSEVSFQPGDKVLVKKQYLRGNVPIELGKQEDLWQGPWKIIREIHPNLYEVDLPVEFHVSRKINVINLKLYKESVKRVSDSEPDIIEEKEEYEIEKIVAERPAKGCGGAKQYLIRRKGWTSEYDSWIHEGNLKHAPEIVADWRNSHGKFEGKIVTPIKIEKRPKLEKPEKSEL